MVGAAVLAATILSTGADAATGQASVYAAKFAGRRTASGERYDPAKSTAAHRSLPFGTRVRVRNLANGRSTVVRVNDRGRLAPGRIIDLSPAAARAIGMDPRGLARVEVLRVDAESPRTNPRPGAAPSADTAATGDRD